MRERWSWLWPLLLGVPALGWSAVALVRSYDSVGRPEMLATTAVAGTVVVLLVASLLLVVRWSALRRVAAVRSACPGAVVVACNVDSALHVSAGALGGAMYWQTDRRPSGHGALAVDAYTAMLWFGTPAGLLGFVPTRHIGRVAPGRGRSGLFRTSPALVLTVRVSETATLDLPLVVVRWWGPFARPLRPEALDALVEQVWLRLEAGRPAALPPAV
jgi:hypothetical protein